MKREVMLRWQKIYLFNFFGNKYLSASYLHKFLKIYSYLDDDYLFPEGSFGALLLWLLPSYFSLFSPSSKVPTFFRDDQSHRDQESDHDDRSDGGGRDRNKVSSWGSGGEFIGRFIVNINLGATQAETKAVIFHSSSLFMDPPSTASKNTNSYYCSHHTCWEGMVFFSHGRTVLHSDHLSIIIFDGVESRHFIQGF